jgi:polysaccharide pyruvyl transferase CsaB
MRAVANSDILVSGGGGLYQDGTGNLSLYYYLCLILLAKLFGKKVFVFAAGVSEIKSINRSLTRKVLGMADFVTLRNEDSIEVLNRPGKKAVLSRYEITTDPVFSKNVQIKNLAVSKPAFGFILRPPKTNAAREEEVYAKLADAVQQRFSARIIFIPFQRTQDYDYTLRIMNSMRGVANIVSWNKPGELYNIFSELDMVLSQRLHGLILAALYGIPLIGVSQDSKLIRFLHQFKQKNFDRITDENLYSVLAIINDMWEWREDFRRNSMDILPSLRKKAQRNLELLVETVKKA